jgi:hypothetical protein
LNPVGSGLGAGCPNCGLPGVEPALATSLRGLVFDDAFLGGTRSILRTAYRYDLTRFNFALASHDCQKFSVTLHSSIRKQQQIA